MAITSFPIVNNVAIVGNGTKTVLNITSATVIKPVAGRVAKVSVFVAGSAVGSVNDCITTGAAAVANQIFVIPQTVGVFSVDMPTSTGITVVPGTGQTLAVSYS